MIKFIKTWSFTTLYTLLIIILSLAPLSDDLPLKDVRLIDKWVHFAMYSTVSITAILDIITHHIQIKSVIACGLTLFFFSVVLGGTMEICQGLTTYRSAEWLDFLANSIGAALGFTIFYVFSHLRHNKD